MNPPMEGPDDPEPSGLMQPSSTTIINQAPPDSSFEVYQRNEIDGLRSKNRRLEE